MGTHVDLATTIAALAGAGHDSMKGVDLSPVFADPSTSARDHVLFAQDSAHTKRIQQTRYALRGYFDGRYKYTRFYDQDHELYDLQEDPGELVNLALDRGRRDEVRRHFTEMRALEAAHFA
jgi:arylsulfatase A-like enzyme